jgi:hypothetical protein
MIFLDIDGVLNIADYSQKDKPIILPDKVALLNKINDKIVLTSNWRDKDWICEYLVTNGVKLDVIDKTPFIKLNDRTVRGVEIQEYIINNNCDNYVILDNYIDDLLLCQKEHIIEVNGMVGLTEDDVGKAIKILEVRNVDE